MKKVIRVVKETSVGGDFYSVLFEDKTYKEYFRYEHELPKYVQKFINESLATRIGAFGDKIVYRMAK